MTKTIAESLKLNEAASTDTSSGRMSIQIMTPGWGGSGYYSAEVCEAAAPLFTVGTQMFIDHPHSDGSGLDERGNRSVRDIAAVITEAGRWDPTAQATVAECRVTAPYRDLLADPDVAPHIGLSLRGSATDITIGEADGRSGPIIEGLADVKSVDFVTRAGRGGKILALMESAMATTRAVQHGVSEATVNDTREALQTALTAAYAHQSNERTERVWVYVQDFDDTTVWFRVEAYDVEADSGLFAQTYTNDDGVVSLTGTRTEVRAVTHYVSVTRPDSTITTTTEADQEVTMGKIQIEESEHTGLVDKAGRVDALESENATLKESIAADKRSTRANEIIEARATDTGVEFSPLERRGLLAGLPVKEGALDEEAFTKTVDEAAAERSKAKGAGTVRGFGSDTTPVTESDDDYTAADLDKHLAESLGDLMPRTAVKEA